MAAPGVFAFLTNAFTEMFSANTMGAARAAGVVYTNWPGDDRRRSGSSTGTARDRQGGAWAGRCLSGG
ncbi:hypothetical protein [Leisingera sp. F5]|uniref:hypothetical protein n=1 Tax=Leisingera sp. F5 TaxID=1813816 RepID=UPI000AEE8FFD|nr:hypothetical protein [Leisingera sp. F5]